MNIPPTSVTAPPAQPTPVVWRFTVVMEPTVNVPVAVKLTAPPDALSAPVALIEPGSDRVAACSERKQ